jgi:phage terminase Nu1 subunit (DNA packaging protein)
MSNYKPDAGIPLLTEVIEAPAHDDARADDTAVAMPIVAAAAAPEFEDVPELTSVLLQEDELRRFEQEICERVLQQLLDRIDFVLEQRVRDNLADVLQTAVDHLATDIRQGLQRSLAEVIARAVTQEISRLQTLKK